MRVYRIECDDARCLISGEKPLHLEAELEKALAAMSDDDIIRPTENWFDMIVDAICNNTGFERLGDNVDDTIDIEERYFSEVSKRS